VPLGIAPVDVDVDPRRQQCPDRRLILLGHGGHEPQVGFCRPQPDGGDR